MFCLYLYEYICVKWIQKKLVCYWKPPNIYLSVPLQREVKNLVELKGCTGF